MCVHAHACVLMLALYLILEILCVNQSIVNRKCGCSWPSVHSTEFNLPFLKNLIIDTKKVFGTICPGSCVCYPGIAAAGQRGDLEFT